MIGLEQNACHGVTEISVKLAEAVVALLAAPARTLPPSSDELSSQKFVEDS